MMKNRYAGKLMDDYKQIMAAWPRQNILRAEVAKQLNAKVVVEIGSGYGETTENILKTRKDSTLVAIDPDKKANKVARKKLASYKDRLLVIDGDAEKIMRSITTFDGFTASWTLHNFTKSKRKNILKQAYSKLEKGGKLVIFDKILPDNKAKIQSLLEKKITQIKTKVKNKKLAERLIKHEKEDRTKKYILTEKETITLLKDVGFKNIKITKRIDNDVVLRCNK